MSTFHDNAAALLRCLPPETAHDLTLWGLARGLGPHVAPDQYPILRTELWGLDFANPFGIAAGFDKNAVAVRGTLGLGVGFTEVGGVTPRPQNGNPKPRLFRLPEDRALINRMGFNNDGVETIAARLERTPRGRIVGANLAANADSMEPIDDFVRLTKILAPRAAFLTADISCPNTKNGQVFLAPGSLAELLRILVATRNESAAGTPLLVKLSPDLDDATLQQLLRVIGDADIAGITICNTTRNRPSSLHGHNRGEAGGLSGTPLGEAALDLLRRVHRHTAGQIPLIGVGGIASATDAYARIKAGASLVQLYTAIVYQGPGLIPRMAQDLAVLLHNDGFAHVTEAVGADHRSNRVTRLRR